MPHDRTQSPAAALAILTAAVLATPATAAGDRALGEYLASECVTCHQISGKAQPGIPSIVGRPAASIVDSLNAYRAKQRPNDVMQTIAGRFSNDEIAALAAYFSSLKPKN